MKTIKRVLLIFLTVILSLGIISCDKKNDAPTVQNGDVVSDISLFDCAVIRPEKSSEALMDEISTLYGRLLSLSDGEVLYETDELKKDETPDSAKKEILIGHTNRPETAEALAKISGSEFIITVIGNKVIVTGLTDNTTIAAVRYFVEAYLGAEPAEILSGELSYKGVADVTTLVENGTVKYTLVCNADDKTATDQMGRVYNTLRAITGANVVTANDSAAADPNAMQILFGYTVYEESDRVARETEPEGYSIDFIGNKIVIFGWTGENMVRATDAFIDLLMASYHQADSGEVTLTLLDEKISTDKGKVKFYKDVPQEVDGNEVDRIYDAGDSAMMLYWADVQAQSFVSYTGKIEQLGFAKYQSHENDSIVSATYVKNGVMTHVYYLKRTSELRVITQENATLPINAYEYTKVCEPLVIQICTDKRTLYNGGGMGYIIRLADGTFLVIDGGYDEENHYNSKVIYDLLVKYKPAEVEDIVVTAWIVTHPHGDHMGGFVGMAMSEYADDITVKTLIGNDTSDYLLSVIDNKGRYHTYANEASRFPGCKYVKAHTGQQFYFPGVTIDTIYSPADVYPDFIYELNSAATISFNLIVEGENKDFEFLFIADNTVYGSERIAEMYGEDLKCDVIQIGHHGGNGGCLELYRLCEADIALWPIPQPEFDEGGWKRWPQVLWAYENIDTHIIQGDGTAVISFDGNEIVWEQFPYTE